MVSIFPPNYSIAPIFNVPDYSIIEIIETGYSELIYNKAEKLLNKYIGSLGIDEEEIPFIKNIKKRCAVINEDPDKDINYKYEINKAIVFLKELVSKKENYFSDYVKRGRELKKNDKALYIQHKTTSITYTPFGVFNNRENKSFRKTSNLLYFDIDIKTTLAQKRKIIQFFLDEEYIRTSWLSFSGTGFGFIVESDWTTEEELKKNYYKLLEYFTIKLKQSYGFYKRVFDTQVCSLSRMNFISQGLIKNKVKGTYKVFKTVNYSNELFNLLHLFYKKDSLKEIPNYFLTEEHIIKKETVYKPKQTITSDQHFDFLERITAKLNFTGSSDYNGTIKNYVSLIFRYDVDDSIIEDFLFKKIPYNKGTEQNFRRLWKCYSGYSPYRTVKPYIYI